ncbi:serine hydrolase [Arenicella sp. 4NH20-0111]|uniref:serine hydrolase domain-containing protein n=1 Tax=Arenicella sp. 4NH20-0111 TaxID=3127648 RepID=UPI00334261DC
MKIVRSLIIGLMSICLVAVVGLLISGNGFILTSIKRTYLAGHITANINDHQVFNVRSIPTAAAKTPLLKHEKFNKTPLPTEFLNELKVGGSAAFLVIKDGKVISENYFNGYDDRSKTNSFSMAKTVTTLLLGIAIQEGHVTGLDQPITDFIPEFSSDPLAKSATIANFSLMNSGYEWDENYYTPFSPTVELYYGGNIEEFLLSGEFSMEPGTFWEYSSASTQIMGIFLLRALQKAGAADTLSEYLSKKIWQPMQMNDDAAWHLDNSGMELVYCCLNTNARNFAKLGLLMINGGNWNGQQLVPQEFVKQMIQPVGQPFYGLSTWLALDRNPAYYWYSGHLGQYIINVPEHNTVIVRLGERMNPDEDFRSITLPRYVEMATSIL